MLNEKKKRKKSVRKWKREKKKKVDGESENKEEVNWVGHGRTAKSMMKGEDKENPEDDES